MKPTYKTDHTLCPYFRHGGRIVCGTSGLGGVWGQINPDESVQAILYALQNGVRAFDTAPSYANAELYLGQALREWKGEKPFISTKVGRQRGETAFDFMMDYTDDGMERSLHRSLKLLGVNKIDLLFLHEPHLAPLTEIDRIINCLHRFKAQNLVDYIGVGGNPNHAFYPFIKKQNFDVVSGYLKLDACNLTALNRDTPLFSIQEIAYYAASSLHFSLLGNRFQQYLSTGPDGTYVTQKDIDNACKVNLLSQANNLSLSTLSQRYLFSIAEATRVVVGARNVKQMQDTLNDWKAGPLPRNLFNDVTNLILA